MQSAGPEVKELLQPVGNAGAVTASKPSQRILKKPPVGLGVEVGTVAVTLGVAVTVAVAVAGAVAVAVVVAVAVAVALGVGGTVAVAVAVGVGDGGDWVSNEPISIRPLTTRL